MKTNTNTEEGVAWVLEAVRLKGWNGDYEKSQGLTVEQGLALIDQYVQEKVVEARIDETNSTYDVLQQYLSDEMPSDEITYQLQVDLRKYRSELQAQLNKKEGK